MFSRGGLNCAPGVDVQGMNNNELTWQDVPFKGFEVLLPLVIKKPSVPTEEPEEQPASASSEGAAVLCHIYAGPPRSACQAHPLLCRVREVRAWCGWAGG